MWKGMVNGINKVSIELCQKEKYHLIRKLERWNKKVQLTAKRECYRKLLKYRNKEAYESYKATKKKVKKIAWEAISNCMEVIN